MKKLMIALVFVASGVCYGGVKCGDPTKGYYFEMPQFQMMTSGTNAFWLNVFKNGNSYKSGNAQFDESSWARTFNLKAPQSREFAELIDGYRVYVQYKDSIPTRMRLQKSSSAEILISCVEYQDNGTDSIDNGAATKK